jgi:OCT family organic cation transporter-like MFS transporter 4/5
MTFFIKFSFMQTFKLFFRSQKIFILTAVNLINWFTNVCVYYGISFNTSELAGDPYLNFTLSAIVEALAVLMCEVTLDRFGRKIPYAINMALCNKLFICEI